MPERVSSDRGRIPHAAWQRIARVRPVTRLTQHWPELARDLAALDRPRPRPMAIRAAMAGLEAVHAAWC